MAGHWNDPDDDPDPREPSRDEWEPDDEDAAQPAVKKDVLSVTHDLTDDELKRFVSMDVRYDPMPLFGFIPQWVWFTLLNAVIGCFIGLCIARTASSIILCGLMYPPALLGLFEIMAAGRRRHVRAIGLCDNRTVTISPRGLSVRIPAAEGQTSIVGVGPLTRLWSEVRKISTTEDDLMFWMQPSASDLEGRARLVVPLRAFTTPGEAAAFEGAARRWHAVAAGEDAHWWEDHPS
jgi:hypothetical protein